MKYLLSLFVFVGLCFAQPRSLVMPAQTAATAAINLGDISSEFRIELQIAGCSSSVANTRLFAVGPIAFARSTQAAATTTWNATITGSSGGASTLLNLNLPDLTSAYTIRAQRIGTTAGGVVHSMEAWDLKTGTRTVIYTAGHSITGPIAANTMNVGDASRVLDAGCKVAYLRVFNSAVPLDSAPPEKLHTAGTLLNYEFQDVLTDSVSGAKAINYGSPTYADTPTFSPVCHAGTQSAFRSGQSFTLDGSRSYSTNGTTTLSYMWVRASKPSTSTARLLNPRVVSPTVTPGVFGTHSFRLYVTDSGGQQSNCTVTHGLVATDSNGVVTTGNEHMDRILGPMLRYGASPWPWMDTKNEEFVRVRGARVNVPPPDGYNDTEWTTGYTGAGTVAAINSNGTHLTGTGTNFATTFCAGGTVLDPARYNPTYILLKITDPVDSTPIYLRANPVSCASETDLVIDNLWSSGLNRLPTSFTGAQWKLAGESYYINAQSPWTGTDATNNYYDHAVAYYSFCYRSGLTSYCDLARAQVAMWWSHPMMAHGMVSLSNNSTEERKITLDGLALYALDGHPETWPYLRRIWDGIADTYAVSSGVKTGDRDWGYMTRALAMASLIDPDSSKRSTYKTATQTWLNSATGWFGTFKEPAGDHGGYWEWFLPLTWATGTVTVTDGSPTVTITGGTFPTTTSGIFNTCLPTATTNADCDSTIYKVQTRNSDTQITLTTNYSSGQCPSGCSGRRYKITDVAGWGTQPFMQGIDSNGITAAAWAMDGFDATSRDTAIDQVKKSAKFLLDTPVGGYDTQTRGLFYSRGSVCEPDPTTTRDPACINYSSAAPAGAREYHAETLRAYCDAHLFGLSNASTVDYVYGGMFGGPLSQGPNADGVDLPNIDVTQTAKPGKYLGFVYGTGYASCWPATRTLTVGSGWPIAASTISLSIPFTPSSVHPLATKVRWTLTRADGTQTTGTCTTAPCTATYDSRQGGYTLKREYLNSSNVVLRYGTINKQL